MEKKITLLRKVVLFDVKIVFFPIYNVYTSSKKIALRESKYNAAATRTFALGC